CDRVQEVLLCEVGLRCAPTETPGEGVCEPFEWNVVDEMEPNQLPVQAAALALEPGDAVNAALDLEDLYDVFVVRLTEPGFVIVETDTGTPGVCPSGTDTVMARIAPGVLSQQGYEAALDEANRLDFNDDGGPGLCSRIETELPAGTYYFLVHEYQFDRAVPAYTLRVRAVPVRAVGEPCDADSQFSVCGDGLTCSDPNGDLDGVCQ
ncbi:MAG: hypothetical protein KC583_19070, partial [Myxococcales bacterium]|nr:hypothetical protein [Myxococcales bacterium]